MICPYCNKNNLESAKFCGGCGARLTPVQKNNAGKRKQGKGLIPVLTIVAVLLLLVTCAFAVVCFVPDVKEKIFHSGKESSETVNQENGGGDGETGDNVGETFEEGLQKVEDLIAEAQDQFVDQNFAGENGCVALLESAIQKCTELKENYGESDDLDELAGEAFSHYLNTVSAENELLIKQDIRPELYEQMKSNLDGGLEQAAKLKGAGFEADTEELEEELEKIKADYRDRYIERFNQFTESDNWSRSESWAVMNDADSAGLVDHGNMDDPLTQRYAYALARITLKNVEKGLNDRSMNNEDALKEIEAVLEDADYNLFLMSELSNYLSAAGYGAKASEVSRYVEEIQDHIYETQGIKVGDEIPLALFWSFNEFEEEYSVSVVNGLTKENHEWIRSYMKDKNI